MPETLRQKQSRFALNIARLISWAFEHGFEVTLGDAYRHGDPRCHGKRMALDLNLFIDGKYQTTTEAHRPLGEEWERMGGCWGGRFNDGNHYSYSFVNYEGVEIR